MSLTLIKNLKPTDVLIKRGFDIMLSFMLLAVLIWLIFILIALSSLDTGKLGCFTQKRIGQFGKPFQIYKIRTMKPIEKHLSSLPEKNDTRISRFGHFLRKNKLDELPQLFNVLLGQMSFVGPRPDVPGFADILSNEDRIILTVRPGITGPASLKFKNEESLLNIQKDPEQYNRQVIWPEKVKINKMYVKEYSFFKDIKYLYKTLV